MSKNRLPDGRLIVPTRHRNAADDVLVKAGLVPVFAQDLRRGDVVASKQTMFGFGFGLINFNTVHDVRRDDFDGIHVDLGLTDDAEVDELTPCYIIPPDSGLTRYEVRDAVARLEAQS